MKRFLLFIGLTGLAYLLVNNAHMIKNPTNFQTKLIQADTSDITRIIVLPQHKEDTETVLNRTEAGWVATKEVQNILASPHIIGMVMEDISTAKVLGVKELDKEFKKLNRKRVQLFNQHVMVADLVIYVGRMHREMSSGWVTYLNYADGQEVYEIDGRIGFTLLQPFKSYYNKTIANMLPSKMKKVILEENNTSFSIERNSNGHLLNATTIIDSFEVRQYFQGLANVHNQLKDTDFLFDFDEVAAANNLLKTLNIYSVNRPEPVKISLYFDSTAVKPFIIHSSLNKDSYFASDSTGLYQTIFQPWTAFLNEEVGKN